MDVFDAIWTLRAMRRIDSNRPVSDEDLLKCIEAAGKAASGGGREGTRFIVVRNPAVKRKVADAYRKVQIPALEAYAERARGDEAVARLQRSAWYLTTHMDDYPALIVACSEGPPLRFAAAVYPAVQNLMLAARALGLGTTITTIHLQNEAEVKQALGIPDEVATYCLIPIGYPLGRWAEAKRRPVREIAFWDRWGEPPP